MDEPTASLTERETVQLLKFVKKLRDDGVAIIYISHRMDEVFEISDRITVFRDGKYIATKDAKDAINAGIILAPESRKEQGLVLIQDIKFNTVLMILEQLIHGIKTDKKKEDATVDEYMKKLRVKATSSAHITGQLSGGNQQKEVLAKCLTTKPKILILDEPTRGIDVGAKFETYKMITELAEEGVGIIFISSELPEVLNLSTRVVVMHEGKITGELGKEELTEEIVLKYATGGIQDGSQK